MIDEQLLDLLACPLCKSSLRTDGDHLACTEEACGCRYPVEDDIPVALIDEADRPCPDCGTQRDWSMEDETLSCPDCGTSFSPDSSG